MTPTLDTEPLFSTLLTGDLPRLVGLCAHITGDHLAAEDLAQDTLVEAWRHRDRLQDDSGRARWLSAIARNVCMRWQRAQQREVARYAQVVGTEHLDALPDPFDLERDVERAELASVLDRALARLPPITRDVLIARYIAGTPLPDLAARLGLSEAAAAKRLQRGARILRDFLEADRDMEQTDARGSIQSRRQTRMWCPQCGRHRLLGSPLSEAQSLVLRCPGCAVSDNSSAVHIQNPGLLRGVTRFKSAFSRVLAETDRRHQEGDANLEVPCLSCGRPVALRSWPNDRPTGACTTSHGTVLERRCDACGTYEQTSLSVRALAVPAVQRFWREHPRIFTQPERPVEARAGSPVVVVFESMVGADRVEVLVAPDTGWIRSINSA